MYRCAVFTLSLALSSRAFAAPPPSADMERAFEVASLRAAAAEEAVTRMDSRLAAVETLLREGDPASEDLDAQLASLRGALEEVRFAVDKLTKDFASYQLSQEERLLWAEKRLVRLETLLGTVPPPRPCLGDAAECQPTVVDPGTVPPPPERAPPPPSAPPAATTTAPAPPPAESANRVQTARRLMQQGQQAGARALLDAELAAHPADDVAAEATYLLGQTYLNEGQFRDAARAFRDVAERYGKSRWVPAALVRSGECFEGMGRPDDAKIFYQSVLKQFPASDAAAEARAKLGK